MVGVDTMMLLDGSVVVGGLNLESTCSMCSLFLFGRKFGFVVGGKIPDSTVHRLHMLVTNQVS
jgi:hypothetical protein